MIVLGIVLIVNEMVSMEKADTCKRDLVGEMLGFFKYLSLYKWDSAQM